MISAVTEDPMFALIIAHDSEAGSAREGHCGGPRDGPTSRKAVN